MKAGVRRPAEGAPNPAGPSTLVVSTGSDGLRRRIAAALSEQETLVLAEVANPGEIAALEVDETAIVILVCDVDEAREMATLRRLCRETPEPAVVVISASATGTGVRRALDAGADALVFEPELELTLASTVRAVASGQSVVPREFRASMQKPILSHREQQVLALVRSGLTNAEIAKHLYLAESTIKSHISSIFTKFGVRSRKEVAAALIDVEPMPEAAVGFGKAGERPGRATTA
jgi:DNA-binding NarL/FixJ family response regulator